MSVGDLTEPGAPDPLSELTLNEAMTSPLLRDEPHDFAPIADGTIWDGRYEIERSIGEGGMGNVLLAADLANDGQPIALKVLQPRFRDVATAYFLREYSIQRLLRHPGIARAIDLGFDVHDGEEVPYFTMPFVPGEPLANLITVARPLAVVWRWAIEILEALDAIHRAGYLHRDVKPGNILIDEHARTGPAARLIDFGITTALSAEPEEFFIGTPAYSSPERIDCGPHDVRSDLYAVGLLLFELIDGVPPWDTTDIDELLVLRRAQPPEVCHPGCPAAMRALITELLAPDPEDRPASAAVVIQRMKRALDMPVVLGSTAAFQQRLAGLPVPCPAYARALELEGELVLVHVPDGHAVDELLGEIGDRAALRGVRVVHVRLTGRAGPPLAELEGALDVFRRLREREGNPSPFRGMAGAATMLTRLHRQTMLVVEGLEHADEATLMVLSHAFTGAKNAFLTVVASLSSVMPPRAGRAMAALEREEYVKHVTLEDLTREETHLYVATLLGSGLIADEAIDALHDLSGGRPLRIRDHLVDAFEAGVLVRQPDGYAWTEPPPPATEEASTLIELAHLTTPIDGAHDEPGPLAHAPRGAVAIAARVAATLDPRRSASSDFGPDAELELQDRLAILQSPFPTDAVVAFLGGSDNYQRLLQNGVLQATENLAACVHRDACNARYGALSTERRRALHRALADALIALPEHVSSCASVAEQLLLTDRPAAAAPYFARVAHEERAQGLGARASQRIAKAIALVESDQRRDAELVQWRLEVFGAALDHAESLDDDERLLAATEQLLGAGADAADLPAIERAMQVQIDRAQDMWDAITASEAVDRLLQLQRSCAGTATTSLVAWVRGFECALAGDAAGALRLTRKAIQEGAEAAAGASPIERWARQKLHALQAEVAARGSVVGDAQKSLALYVQDAAAEVPPVRAALLESLWLRRRGDLTGARAKLASYESDNCKIVRRALIDLELAECDLALGRCDPAIVHARRALEGARKERNPVVAFAAESVLVGAFTRKGEPAQQLEHFNVALRDPPAQIPPQIIFEAKLRWLGARMALGEGLTLVADTAALTRDAVRLGDSGTVARSAFIMAQVELRANRPMEALRHVEWVQAITSKQPIGGPPRHAIEWLLASVHYQMKWFKSASALSGRAMESLRMVAHAQVATGDREQWLRSGDNLLIGLQR